MNSIKRIYLACRAAIAEIGPLLYLLPVGIMVAIAAFIIFTEGESSEANRQLLSEFSFWDPATIVSLLVNAGWISGLIVCGTIHNRWFKEENQAVRSLSLPLSNGERFAAMIVIYLGFVPLVCFGLPLLLAFLVYPFAPESVFLPSATYLWKSLAIGGLVHLATCAIWLQPSFVFGKKVILALIGMIIMVVLYIIYTHGSLPSTVDVPHFATSVTDDNVVGLIRYEPQLTESQEEVIKIKYSADESIYFTVQFLLMLLMLAAGGLALTKKTA